MKASPLLLLVFLSCNRMAVTPEKEAAIPTPADSVYSGTFYPMDGTWKGDYFIMNDERGQPQGPAKPKNLSPSLIASLPLDTTLTIKVTRQYASTGPFHQNATHTDVYIAPNGEYKVETIEAQNKVEGGQLWAILDKPGERVVHNGIKEDQNSIVWQRSLNDPMKLEYFHEKVEDDTYTVMGWGYYDQDDVKKAPRTWFFGVFKRQ